MAATINSGSSLETSIADNALQLTDKSSSRTAFYLNKDLNCTDYIFEADFTMTYKNQDSRWMGIVFGMQDNGSYAKATLGITKDGTNGEWIINCYNSISNSYTDPTRSHDNGGVYISSAALDTSYNIKIVNVDGVASLYIGNVLYYEYDIPDAYLSVR